VRRVSAVVAYDGTLFSGFQTQEGVRTVEQEIEKALSRIFKEDMIIDFAGRTDTGVHANGQIISFMVKYQTMEDHDVKNALNANLPPDIYVRSVQSVNASFNPRFLATRRIYHYFLLNTREPDLFTRNRYWWFPYPLDVVKMREGAKYLEGVHDFSTFMKKDRFEEKNPVRILYRVRVVPLQRKGLILFRVEGHSFLRRMVRNIVGAVVRVGTGQWKPEKMAEIIRERTRTALNTTAPPEGLYLYRVDFDPVPVEKYIKNAYWSENHLREDLFCSKAD
jgi:tRNA pseudouridine38-40 synthase